MGCECRRQVASDRSVPLTVTVPDHRPRSARIACVRAAPEQAVAVTESRMAMCLTCPHALTGWRAGHDGRERWGVIICMEGGSIADGCPVGRHETRWAAGDPGMDEGYPVIRWLGVEWIGVPMPLRLYLAVVWSIVRRHRSPAASWRRAMSLAGCGCVRRLKLWCLRMGRPGLLSCGLAAAGGVMLRNRARRLVRTQD